MRRVEIRNCRSAGRYERRFLSRRLRGIVDLLTAVMVLGVVTGLAASSYRQYLGEVNVTRAISDSNMIKKLMTKTYYETGVWPSEEIKVLDYSGEYVVVNTVKQAKGGYTLMIELSGKEYRLTVRAAESSYSVRAPMLWLCGYDKVPQGYRTFSDNQTNIPKRYLPKECKGSDNAE